MRFNHPVVNMPNKHPRTWNKGIVVLHPRPHTLFQLDLSLLEPQHLVLINSAHNLALGRTAPTALLAILQQEIFVDVDRHAQGFWQIASAIGRQQ
jgi:hypothetical protein